MHKKVSKVRVGGETADVLGTPQTLPGVNPEAGHGWIVLLFPGGEVKYYRRNAVEDIEWSDI